MAVGNLEEGLAVLDRRTSLTRIVLIVYLIGWTLMLPITWAEATGAYSIESDLDGPLLLPVSLVMTLSGLVMLVSFVVVGMWIHRAHANLRLAGLDGLEYTPGWSVGWFFIPFANLVKPFQAMRELWNRSLALDDSYGQSDSGPYLPLWWGGWIIGNILSNISSQLAMRGEGLLNSTCNYIDLVGTVFLLGSAWVLLQIVNRVSNAQNTALRAYGAFT